MNEIDNFSENVKMCIFVMQCSLAIRGHQVFELSHMYLVYKADNLLGCIRIKRVEDAL